MQKAKIKHLDDVIHRPEHIKLPEFVLAPSDRFIEIFPDSSTLIGYYILFAVNANMEVQQDIFNQLMTMIAEHTSKKDPALFPEGVTKANEAVKAWFETYRPFIGQKFEAAETVAQVELKDGDITIHLAEDFVKMREGKLEFDVVHNHPAVENNFYRTMLEKLLSENQVKLEEKTDA